MKKLLATFVLAAMMLIALPLTSEAHPGCRAHRRVNRSRSYASQRYYAPQRYYASQGYYAQRRRPSFYQRHRNLINIGIGTGAGALIGGLTRGKKGAIVGGLAGAGAGALYTYVLRPKRRY